MTSPHTAPGRTVPDEILRALAAGSGGNAALELLNAVQHGKHLLLVRHIRALAPRTATGYDLLKEVQKNDREAADRVLRYPTVGVWAWRTARALEDGRSDDPRADGMALLAAAAAVRARFPAEIGVPVRDGAVTLPSLGRALLPGATTARVRSGPHGAAVTGGDASVAVPADPHRDAPGWQALRRLTAESGGRRLDLLLDDHDPYRMPGTARLGDRLPEAEVERWRATLRGAWELLVPRHWTICAETAAVLRTLSPLPAPEGGGQSSATAQHAFGGIGLSEPPHRHFFAVTFAHEVQHTKLTALLDAVPLTAPDDGARYRAPWRDDPRPVAGLLQGAYAHLGIAGFWRRQRHHESGDMATYAHTCFARWRDAALWVCRTLAASGGLTPHGRVFVAGMTRTLEDWAAEPVPPAALAAARAAEARRLADWRERNGPLPALQRAT
ncbi:HEXXH motif domain-containing protein [Actinomadura kijaniata]|uniref:HEXXH motif-containing protein n=1 Tax=Actinomadura namibiensis TaxID=182080 RepID=A0A7W3LPS6_ACTNM|nr:HEXXH motif domain-containing protein [Actinomadura namibiensis]MBA8951997.1 HEXXH motif-containing protein [Actinomadura namibiensis]